MRFFHKKFTRKFVGDELGDVFLEERLDAEGKGLVLLLYGGNVFLHLEKKKLLLWTPLQGTCCRRPWEEASLAETTNGRDGTPDRHPSPPSRLLSYLSLYKRAVL